MSNAIDFGVQSYCFRHFKDNAVVAEKVRGIGLSKIELCRIHGNFNDLAAFGEVVKIYRDAGVGIVSLGVERYIGKDSERQIFESGAIAGVKHLSAHVQVDTFMTAIPKLRQWSREFGIRVGIHCHGGYMFGGSRDVLDYLLALGGPEVGLCIDTAWAMQLGPRAGDPVEWVKRYAGRIYGIHFKDFVFERNGQWKDVVVGTGNLDLLAFSKALVDSGFDGMAGIEYEADVESPDNALKCCVDSMRAAI